MEENKELTKIGTKLEDVKAQPLEQIEITKNVDTKKETKKYKNVVEIIDDLKNNPEEIKDIIAGIGDKVDWDKFKPVTESQFDKIMRFSSEKLILLLATLVSFFRKYFSSNLFMTVSIMVIQISLFCVSIVDLKICWIYSTVFATTAVVSCALLYNVYKTDKNSEKYSEIQNTTLKYLRNKFSKVKE
jgi:hypothetical protein